MEHRGRMRRAREKYFDFNWKNVLPRISQNVLPNKSSNVCSNHLRVSLDCAKVSLRGLGISPKLSEAKDEGQNNCSNPKENKPTCPAIRMVQAV